MVNVFVHSPFSISYESVIKNQNIIKGTLQLSERTKLRENLYKQKLISLLFFTIDRHYPKAN